MNYKIIIDPGHGGSDAGASGNGIIEKDLTLAISKYMYDAFKKMNIPVSITRDSDITLNPTERVNKILNTYGNNPNVIVISNHINAGGGDGAEVIYALRNTDKLANLILNSLEAAGQNVRKAYQKRLPSNTDKDYYFIHRETGKTEPIIVEYGFLDSKADDVNQLKNNYQKYAQAVADAVAEYIGIQVNDMYYTVQKGDSLYSIAKKFNTTVDALKDANNLTNNNLAIGQILIIPSKEVENNGNYIVVAGDTLYKIANKFNTTVDAIKALNNLSNNTLSIGQSLKIPTQENANDNYQTYTVVKGDNLYSIAKKFNTTQDAIMKLNNLSSNLLSIGQTLKIPTNDNSSTNYQTYIVQKGDSLWSIAKKFSTTVDNIKKLNNLSSNLLSIGQTLKI